MPNTATAKLGVYPNVLYPMKLGFFYVLDWCANAPFGAAGALIFWLWAVCARKNAAAIAAAAGIALHTLWVVWAGGDFMRGRFLMPAFTASLILGSLALARHWGNAERGALVSIKWTFGCLLLVAVLNQPIGDAIHSTIPPGMGNIVNERQFYPGYSLREYLREGKLTSPYTDLEFAEELRAYAEELGPIAIHHRNPGTIGYFAGPNVTVIDTLGLTDRFIAELPNSYLVDPYPRAGHPDKRVPIKYLASRGDVSLIEDWEERIRQRDPALKTQVGQYTDSDQLLIPKGAKPVIGFQRE